MMFPLTLLALALCASAQTPPAPKPAAPAASAEVTPATVVAEVDGKKLTAADIDKIAVSIPPQMRQNYAKDPKGFLSQWFLLKKIASLAETEKLDQKSPYKEGIELQRASLLMQALINERTQNTPVSVEEQKKAYEQRKDQFAMAKVKIIYVPMVTGAAPPDAARKTLTEAEALARSEGLVKEARAGKDFVALVKQHSEDPISKERDGDFGPIRRADKLPDAIKNAVFALKAGEVSDPVRQPNGYYILKLTEFTTQPFEEVQDSLHSDLRNQQVRQWMESMAKATEVKVEKQDYFDKLRQQQ